MKSNDDRYDVTFAKISRELPDPDTNLVCVSFNQDYVPLLVGWLGFLRAKFPYADHYEANQDKIMRLFDRFTGCDMLSDIKIENGGLYAQYCDSESWVLIGKIMTGGIRYVNGAVQYDFDGDGTYEVTQYIDASTNNYINGLAPASNSAKACYAAQQLAKNVADDFKDLLELLNASVDLIFGNIAEISESVFGSLPAEIATAGLAEILVAAIDISYQTTQSSLEYIIPQVADPDVVDQIAEFIYCALLESLVTTDGVTDLVDFEVNLLEKMGAYYVELFTFGAVDVGFGLDFGEALSDLVGVSQHVIAGLACAYSLSQVYFLGGLGLKDTWKTVILGYYQEGQYFEDRDCSGYDCAPQWCYEWSFTSGAAGWFDDGYLGDHAQWGCVWSSGGFHRTGTKFMAMTFTFPSSPGTRILSSYWEGTGTGLAFEGTSYNQAAGETYDYPTPWDWQAGAFQVAYGVSKPAFNVTKIRIVGDGPMPTLTGGSECEP